MCFSKFIKKILRRLKNDGLLCSAMLCTRKLINIFYRIIVWHNFYADIDYTTTVEGIKNIEIKGRIKTGKYFWISTYEQYGDQCFSSRIIFKGNFYASDFCHISATHYIEIGDNVLLGSKVYITDNGHGIYSGDATHSLPTEQPIMRCLDSDKEVVIGDNVWIGDNVTVLPNVHIGKGCVIGANSVVTKDIPDNCIAVGIPAKVIKKFDYAKKKWVRVQ